MAQTDPFQNYLNSRLTILYPFLVNLLFHLFLAEQCNNYQFCNIEEKKFFIDLLNLWEPKLLLYLYAELCSDKGKNVDK